MDESYTYSIKKKLNAVLAHHIKKNNEKNNFNFLT